MIVGGERLLKIAREMGIPEDQVQPSSIDLRIDGEILEIPSNTTIGLQLRSAYHRPSEYRIPINESPLIERAPSEWKRLGILEHAHYYRVPFGKEFIVLPFMFYLASTRERIYVPKGMRAIGAMRSTPARHGITHSTALYIDPCFQGQLTLEFTTSMPAIIVSGMRFVQIEFAEVDGADCYQGKYLDQEGVTMPKPERKF